MNKSGFTLIELLVVIAIFAIIAAVVLPFTPWGKGIGKSPIAAGNYTITVAKTWTITEGYNKFVSTKYMASDTKKQTYVVSDANVYGALIVGQTVSVTIGPIGIGGSPVITAVGSASQETPPVATPTAEPLAVPPTVVPPAPAESATPAPSAETKSPAGPEG